MSLIGYALLFTLNESAGRTHLTANLIVWLRKRRVDLLTKKQP